MKKWKINLKTGKSSTYILPLFDQIIKFKHLNFMIGSFLYNNKDDKSFSVLYKFSGKEFFSEYEHQIMNHHLFIGHEDYDEYVLWKFKVPRIIAPIIELFIQGKYSEFPIEAKDSIESFIEKRGFNNSKRVRMILDKHKDMREELSTKLKAKIPITNELSEAPNLERENFSNNVEKIIINVKNRF